MKATPRTSGDSGSPVNSNVISAIAITSRYKDFLSSKEREGQTHFSLGLHALLEADWWPRWTVTTQLLRRPRFRRFCTIYVLARSVRLKNWSATGDTTWACVHPSTMRPLLESSLQPASLADRRSKLSRAPQ